MKRLSQKLVNLLGKKKLKISFAESCTGGLLSSTITSIGGSSKVFTLGLVTYSNQSKINTLKVPKKIIIKHGAVSYETCLSMVKNLDNKDPKEVVIDEFIGQSIPICLYEIAHEGTKEPSQILTSYFIMFILFRIFDIVKPYPVSYYDKNFKNSFGVIMDDVCAGLYVVAILVLYMVITS